MKSRSLPRRGSAVVAAIVCLLAAACSTSGGGESEDQADSWRQNRGSSEFGVAPDTTPKYGYYHGLPCKQRFVKYGRTVYFIDFNDECDRGGAELARFDDLLAWWHASPKDTEHFLLLWSVKHFGANSDVRQAVQDSGKARAIAKALKRFRDLPAVKRPAPPAEENEPPRPEDEPTSEEDSTSPSPDPDTTRSKVRVCKQYKKGSCTKYGWI